LRLAGYLFNAAPKDGTLLGTFSRSIPTMPLFQSEANFDGARFTWIGSIATDTSLCITGPKSAVRSWSDMLNRPVVMGGQSTGSDSDIYSKLYRNVFGAKIRLVPGYPGTNEINLAMERGEVDGNCGLSWSTIAATHPEWVSSRSVNFLAQAGLRKEAALQDVPLVLDLTDDPEKKQILNLHIAPQGMGRPFAAPPGIPADRKAALMRAFDATMRDPEFLAAMANVKMPVSPMTGAEMETLLKQLLATPRDIVAKAAQAIMQ
jgi:tripartite-type tricarboxylate transporter receptor subunit TctC